MVDGSYRVSGSSKFGSDHRYAPFWSVGAGWNLHNEKFIKKLGWVNTLRLRGSYGYTGSVKFSSYQAVTTYKYNSDFLGYTGVGAIPIGMANPDLKWQTTKKFNVGITSSFLGDRLNVNLDVYNEKTIDMLIDRSLPPSSGTTSVKANLGSQTSNGIEFSVWGKIIRTKDWEWGLLALGNAIGVIMGANIGTTLTAWMISLFGFSYDIGAFAVPFIALGFFMMTLKSNRNRNIGEFIIGFAFLLIGLATMKNSVPDLNQYPDVLALVKNLTSYGFFSVIIFTLVGALITVIVQASSASLALTMVFVANGWINFEMAAAMVLGANIGTTITANIAAAVANYSAKRTAIANTLFNVIGVVLALVFFNPLMRIIASMTTAIGFENPVTLFDGTTAAGGFSPEQQNSMLYGICILHTVFNLSTTLILVWFIPQLVKAVNRIIPTPKGEEEVYRLKFIQGGPLSTAELSLDEAKQEIIHFAEICCREVGFIRSAVSAKTQSELESVNEKLVKYESITDKIEYEIASYLNEVSKGDISAVSALRIKSMYRVIGELESIGDSGEAIGRMMKRALDHGKTFDDEMVKRLDRMLDLLDVAFKAMVDNLESSALFLKDISNAEDAEYNINEYRNSLREEHIVNIEKEGYNYQTGVFYIDIVQELEKMGDFIINISQSLLEKND